MTSRIIITILLALVATSAIARNEPCSGKKGGIDRCQGDTFICVDGSVSASKKSCQMEMGGMSLMNGGQAANMAETSNGECSCRGGQYCVGPRGGHYCITDSGDKSYLRKN